VAALPLDLGRRHGGNVALGKLPGVQVVRDYGAVADANDAPPGRGSAVFNQVLDAPAPAVERLELHMPQHVELGAAFGALHGPALRDGSNDRLGVKRIRGIEDFDLVADAESIGDIGEKSGSKTASNGVPIGNVMT
jgi:hypothetical protein